MPFSFLLFSQSLTCKEVHDPTSPASSLVQPAQPILIPSRLRNDAPVPSGPGMWSLWPITSKVVWLWLSPPPVCLQAVLCKKQFIFIDNPPSHFSWNPLHRGTLWNCEAPDAMAELACLAPVNQSHSLSLSAALSCLILSLPAGKWQGLSNRFMSNAQGISLIGSANSLSSSLFSFWAISLSCLR